MAEFLTLSEFRQFENRLKALDAIATQTQEIAISVAESNVKLESLSTTVQEFNERLKTVEAKDGSSFRRILESLAAAAVGAGIVGSSIIPTVSQNAGHIAK